MRSSKGKTSFTILRRFSITLLGLVCCSALVAGLYCLYHPGYQRLRDINRQVEIKREKVRRIEAENDELAAKIRVLKTPADNPLHFEKAARQKIGLVKDGETVYHLAGPDER
jgi:cell division protein FtsB